VAKSGPESLGDATGKAAHLRVRLGARGRGGGIFKRKKLGTGGTTSGNGGKVWRRIEGITWEGCTALKILQFVEGGTSGNGVRSYQKSQNPRDGGNGMGQRRKK